MMFLSKIAQRKIIRAGFKSRYDMALRMVAEWLCSIFFESGSGIKTASTAWPGIRGIFEKNGRIFFRKDFSRVRQWSARLKA